MAHGAPAAVQQHTNPPKQSQRLIDVLAGLTVAFALVPEAVAFALVAGVPPLVGMYAAVIVGLITAVIGGRPGMISGAAGALAVVMVDLVKEGNARGIAAGFEGDQGLQYLFATVLLMGTIQITAGVFRLGKFIRLIPAPVMLGFVNGLAIVIGWAQFGQFKTLTEPGNAQTEAWLGSGSLGLMIGLIVVTMAMIHFLPKINKNIPSALVAIAVITAVVVLFDIDTGTVGTYLVNRTGNADASISFQGIPWNGLPDVPYTWETLIFIAPYAIILASIGLIESLMTLSLIDDITGTRGRGNKECVGQGVANVTCGFFSAMGGCAMIGQSMIAVTAGGRGRTVGITAAVGLLIFILFAAPVIEMVPLAALVGVMFIVVIATFEWTTFKVLRKMPLSDALTVILVTTVTVMTDLAIAVAIGVVWSALVFAWQSARHMQATRQINDQGQAEYRLLGPLFFGSTTSFRDVFRVEDDPKDVIIDFGQTRVWDHSGIEAIQALADRYRAVGKTLHLRHLSQECHKLLDKAGNLVEVNRLEGYFIADDRERVSHVLFYCFCYALPFSPMARISCLSAGNLFCTISQVIGSEIIS